MPCRNGLQVLLVEPQEDHRYMFACLLELLGCQTRSVSSGADALVSVKARPPDIIFSELVLDDVGGLELAKQIRSMPEAENTLLVAVTGYHHHGIEDDAYNVGFAGYLLKPIAFDEIVNVLRPLAIARGCTFHLLQPSKGATA